MKLILIIVFLNSISFAHAVELKAFQSDGCSAFPDGTLEQNNLWLICCFEHDKSYWQGGTYQDRKNADKSLKQCVADVGEPAIARLMLAAVRVGGSPYLPTSFRWGYGWPYPRGYKALTDAEQTRVRAMLRKVSDKHWEN
ncbi:MAG: hypothetical protein QNL62_11945 [Gammaproteobacteria bacterium]|nr:hypothetical protein [Gammaproteobacteria bacterium]